jgi:hypothetical protein
MSATEQLSVNDSDASSAELAARRFYEALGTGDASPKLLRHGNQVAQRPRRDHCLQHHDRCLAAPSHQCPQEASWSA